MALLDQLYKEGHELVVAHVNYKKRETADRDEMYVRQYCEKRGLCLRVLYPVYDGKTNFQSWARMARYQFFFDLAKEEETDRIYIAHHLDDHIETYLFQKRRHMLCDTFGLASAVRMHGFRILRPLLMSTKKELEAYCIKQGVSYGIDESNLTDDYTRNQIRHEVIDGLSLSEKKSLAKMIKQENKELDVRRMRARKFIDSWSRDVASLSKEVDAWFILDVWLYEKIGKHLSKKHLCSLLEQMQKDCLIDLGAYDLESFQGFLYSKKKQDVQEHVFTSLTYGKYPGFSLEICGQKMESVHLEPSDFPIRVRTVQKGDRIQLRFGSKKIARFFVDRKIPKIYRKDWLVLENKAGKVIFVPGIGCDVEHFSIKPNMFMIQYLT